MQVRCEAVHCQFMRGMTAWPDSRWLQVCQLLIVEGGPALALKEGRPPLWHRQPTSSAQLHCTSHSKHQAATQLV